jgi:hypothetical protein
VANLCCMPLAYPGKTDPASRTGSGGQPRPFLVQEIHSVSPRGVSGSQTSLPLGGPPTHVRSHRPHRAAARPSESRSLTVAAAARARRWPAQRAADRPPAGARHQGCSQPEPIGQQMLAKVPIPKLRCYLGRMATHLQYGVPSEAPVATRDFGLQSLGLRQVRSPRHRYVNHQFPVPAVRPFLLA